MQKSFWDRVQDLEESINGGVEPLETVTLNTGVVKGALGMYLIQSVIIALVLSVKYASWSAWLIPMSALLQVGWLWNKVTDYWKYRRGYRRVPTGDADIEAQFPQDSVNPPTININTASVPNNWPARAQSPNHPLQNSTTQENGELWSTASDLPNSS